MNEEHDLIDSYKVINIHLELIIGYSKQCLEIILKWRHRVVVIHRLTVNALVVGSISDQENDYVYIILFHAVSHTQQGRQREPGT